MKWFDHVTESVSRKVAQNSSRRSFLSGFGTALIGGAAIPILPVARAADAHGGGQPGAPLDAELDDPTSCDYWRNCSIDGFLCSCCGGTSTSCPPGTEMSPITWIGTCKNPHDGKDYIISYNDCCGKTSCGNCFCNTNVLDRPTYRPHTANDINWCLGTESAAYHCTVTLVLGVATKKA
jgi:methylamine dehydrogenase light chain